MEKKSKGRKGSSENKGKTIPGSMAYRLKCAKTANGLSHFVMYGDVPKGKTAL